jgi:serine/threonine-protein kinase
MSCIRLPLSEGDIVASMYQVGQVLGAGATGVVFAATHMSSGTKVAIKCLLPKHAGSESLVRRLYREAHVGARLRSKQAVRVLDFGTLDPCDRHVRGTEGDLAARAPQLPYLVLERLEGIELALLLRARGRIEPCAAADYVAQACCALAEAHALGLVHRDIKPGNLFLTRRDATDLVKVMDFGIAKFMSSNAAGDRHQLTVGDALLGTPSYMSPEQISDPADVDARADIWSLGVTLYRLASGIAPFRGDTHLDLAISIVNDSPPPLRALCPDVPSGLDAVVQRCLQKRREDRYPSATALGRALAPFVYRSSWTAENCAPPTVRSVSGEETLPGAQSVS